MPPSREKALVGVSATATPRRYVLTSKANRFPMAPACNPHGAGRSPREREKNPNPVKCLREGRITGGSVVLNSHSAHTETSPLPNLRELPP